MQVRGKKIVSLRRLLPYVAGVLWLFFIIPDATAVGTEVQPPERREPDRTMATSKDKVFLEAANELEFNELITPDFQILRGDVQFRKDSMYMFCDSAYFYEKSNSLDAFGNVRMEQGDTLFIYGDELYYDGETQLARIRHNVRMINRDVVLTTDSFNYDMEINIGYYFNGGEVADTVNRLNSFYGQYSPDTKNAVFNYDVKLFNPQFTLYSDTLEYNTTTKVADILGPSVIVSDSNTIYSSLGFYNTAEDVAQLYNRSLIVSKSQKLTGDTIFYDRNNGFGEVFGRMVVDDTLRMMQMHGHYGFYNERREESFATDSALMIDYSQPDTLYLHADTLESLKLNNTKRVLLAYHDACYDGRPDYVESRLSDFRRHDKGVYERFDHRLGPHSGLCLCHPAERHRILRPTVGERPESLFHEWRHYACRCQWKRPDNFLPPRVGHDLYGNEQGRNKFLDHVYEKSSDGQVEDVAYRRRYDDSHFETKTRHDFLTRL